MYPLFLMDGFRGDIIPPWQVIFLPSVIWKSHVTLFWPVRLLWDLLSGKLGHFLCVFLLMSWESYSFENLIIKCLKVSLFLRSYRWHMHLTWVFIFFFGLGNFTVSLNIPSSHFRFSSPSGTPITWMSALLILSQSVCKL